MRPIPAPATGTKFGRWTVLCSADSQHGGLASLCKCECGKEGVVVNYQLRKGLSMSCGCLANDRAAEAARSRATHGLSRTREYRIWVGMKARCYNPKQTGFENYGGKGVVVCDRWLTFENFFVDMGPAPSAKHSIDRRDSNGNYEPNNCRWATDVEQGNNRIGNVLIEYDGRRQTVAQWARELGMTWMTIRYRLKKGWPVEKIFFARRLP